MKTTNLDKACDFYVEEHVNEFLNWIHGSEDYEAMKSIIESAFVAGVKWQRSKEV